MSLLLVNNLESSAGDVHMFTLPNILATISLSKLEIVLPDSPRICLTDLCAVTSSIVCVLPAGAKFSPSVLPYPAALPYLAAVVGGGK